MAEKAAAFKVAITAASGAFAIASLAADLGDKFLDSLTLHRQDDASINARFENMKARRLETDLVDVESRTAFVPANHTIPEIANALSARFPHIAASIKLLSVSSRVPIVKAGITICSHFGTVHNDQSLTAFLITIKRYLNLSSPTSFSFDIMTASEDSDDDAEHVLADSLYKIINKECPLAEGAWPYVIATRSREEITPEDAGKVIARTGLRTTSVRTESQGYRFPSIVVTGKTGAGKSALCRIIAGEMDNDQNVFQTARGTTGTTQIRAKLLSICRENMVLVDTPGLGDRHGADSLSVISMTQQLVGEGKTVAHIHVVKHDEDRPGVVDKNVLERYADILGRALVARLFVVVTHKNSYNVAHTTESWQEHVIASSTGESGRALQVVDLNLDQMDWDTGKHQGRASILSGVEKCLRLGPTPNQRISEMEAWLTKIKDGTNIVEAEKARLVYKERYGAHFQQVMHCLWKKGKPQVWCSRTACLLRAKTGFRVFGNRSVETIVLLFGTPVEAVKAKKIFQLAEHSFAAVEAVSKNMVPVSYDGVLSQKGVMYESETNYFKIVKVEDLIEVVVEESIEEVQVNTMELKILFQAAGTVSGSN